MDARDPRDATAHALAAAAMLDVRRYDVAETEAGTALAIDPNLVLAHHMLAASLLAQDRLIDARRAIEDALKLDSSDAGLHLTLASIEYRQGQVSRCEATIRAAISLEPLRADSYRMLAEVLLAETRLAEALQATHDGLAMDPDDHGLYDVEAQVLARLGQFDEAQASALRGLEIAPDSSSLHNQYGDMLSFKGDPVAARERYLEAARLDPEMLAAVYNVERLQRMAEGLSDGFFVYVATTSDRIEASAWWWARRSPLTRASMLIAGFAAGLFWPMFWMLAAVGANLELARFADSRLDRPWHPLWRRNAGKFLGHRALLPVAFAIGAIVVLWTARDPSALLAILFGIALAEPIAFVLASSGRTRLVGAILVTLAVAGAIVAQMMPIYVQLALLLAIGLMPIIFRPLNQLNSARQAA